MCLQFLSNIRTRSIVKRVLHFFAHVYLLNITKEKRVYCIIRTSLQSSSNDFENVQARKIYLKITTHHLQLDIIYIELR